MALNFEKYAQEGNQFLNALARELGHPEEVGRSGILLRAVLHTIRERITISESLHFLSQFPMFLKAVYVDGWKYRDKPLKIDSKEAFLDEIKHHQDQYGEMEFSWKKSTEELTGIVLSEINKHVSEGEFEHIMAQMPTEIRKMIQTYIS